MIKVFFLKTSIVVVVALVLFQRAFADERPNILFIYTDDQSYRTLGSYIDDGARPWARTPNIDRLASEGVRFSHAYGASWCVPSRSVVMTGKQPHAIEGMDLNRDPNSLWWATFGEGYDPNRAKMWPENLRKSGYETAMVGKWHLGQNAGHGRLWDYSVIWDQNTPSGDWYNNQSLSINGADAEVVPGYSTFVYTEFAEEYIRRDHNKPWMMWLCYNAPHLPNTTHPDTADLYTDVEVPVPEDWFGPRAGKPEYMRTLTMFNPDIEGHPHYLNRGTLEDNVRAYNRLVSSLDDSVGQLLESLEETRQLDNTVIIFTSDQGFAWGEHGYAWKFGPYDACLRMPLIVRYPPAAKPGSVVADPVSIIDVVPTVLSFAEVVEPWKIHGRNLRPVIENPKDGLSGRVLLEHFTSSFRDQIEVAQTGEADFRRTIPWWLAVVEGRYKYVRTLVPNEIEEVYDLETDPDEQNNLALDISYRETLLRLRAALIEELEKSDAHFIGTLPVPRE